ncbi:hypothetical protein [Microbulbifer taiwanensis]|uniref:Uncharacterized protein n=1 Tax=Microbulbifer taiwanensis TaxID=986746 RepID=A0ABW1YU88_9GAMM|nr:hypothetical protein [Microbulbifer taiwanensis]
MEEESFISALPAGMLISVVVGLLCTAAFLYCYLSLKKSNNISGLRHLGYFAGAFLVYFISNVFNYTLVPAIILVAAGAGFDWAKVVTEALSSLLNIGATVLFIMGARSAAEHVRT